MLIDSKKVLSKLRLLGIALRKFDVDHGFSLPSGITFNLIICLVPVAPVASGIVRHLSLQRSGCPESYPSVPGKRSPFIRSASHGKHPKGYPDAQDCWNSRNRRISLDLYLGIRILRTALNIIFQVERGRGIARGKGIDLLMVFLAGFLLLLSMTMTSLVAYIQGYRSYFPLDIGPVIRFFLKYVIPFFLSFWMFFLVYKIVPNKNVSLKAAFQAACFVSLLWETAKQCFGWYVLHLGRFSMVYGSVSALAVFFLWVYYSAAILLLGGEVAFLLERENHLKKKG